MAKTLISVKFPHPKDDYLRLVLRRLDAESPYQPYVTHWHNTEAGGYFWGHYFTTYEDALTDLLKRCGDIGVSATQVREQVERGVEQ